MQVAEKGPDARQARKAASGRCTQMYAERAAARLSRFCRPSALGARLHTRQGSRTMLTRARPRSEPSRRRWAFFSNLLKEEAPVAAQSGAPSRLFAAWTARARKEWRERRGAVVTWGVVFFALLVGLLFRTVGVDRIPGLNGDEAGGPTLIRRQFAGDTVNWTTATGRTASRLFTATSAVFEQLSGGVQPSSFYTVRLPSVVAGILAVLLAWLLLRKALDHEAAISAALLVSAFPVLIIMSRVGSELGLVPLAGVVAMAFSLRQSLIGTLISLTVVLELHPVGVFFVPVCAFTLLFGALGNSNLSPTRRGLKAGLHAIAIVVLAYVYMRVGDKVDPFIASVRVTEFPALARDLLRQLTGTQPLTMIVGPPSASMVTFNDYVLGGALVAIFGVGFFFLAARRRMVELGVAVGFVFTCLFYLVSGGMLRVNPEHYRHAFVLSVPAALVTALMVREIFRSKRWPLLATSVSAGLALLFLTAFGVQFFGEFARTGGRGAVIHRTAAIEPKATAYKMLLENYVLRGESRPPKLIVITEEWHIQWPMKYLANGFNGAEVFRLEELGWGAGVPPLLAKGAYAVGYAGGRVEQVVTRIVPPDRLETRVIADTGGQPLLKVWWVR